MEVSCRATRPPRPALQQSRCRHPGVCHEGLRPRQGTVALRMPTAREWLRVVGAAVAWLRSAPCGPSGPDGTPAARFRSNRERFPSLGNRSNLRPNGGIHGEVRYRSIGSKARRSPAADGRRALYGRHEVECSGGAHVRAALSACPCRHKEDRYVGCRQGAGRAAGPDRPGRQEGRFRRRALPGAAGEPRRQPARRDPAADAGARPRAPCRRSGGAGGGRDAGAGQGCRRADRGRLRGTPPRRRHLRGRPARRAAGARPHQGQHRVRLAHGRPGQDGRGLRQGRQGGQAAARQPAAGRQLDGAARRHLRVRRQGRPLDAVALLAGRAHDPAGGGRHDPQDRLAQASRAHRRRGRRLRHEDLRASGISHDRVGLAPAEAHGEVDPRPPGGLPVRRAGPRPCLDRRDGARQGLPLHRQPHHDLRRAGRLSQPFQRLHPHPGGQPDAGRPLHDADVLRERQGRDDQHRADRRLSRRRPSRGGLPAGALRRSHRARDRALARRDPRAQLHQAQPDPVRDGARRHL